MKQIQLLISVCITALLLTSCGGKTTPVITKSDPAAGIYLGGKLPGVSEEMMKDEKVDAKSIVYGIPSFSGSRIGLEKEQDKLNKALPKYSRDRQKMLDELDEKVLSGDIAGYRFVPGIDLTIYSEHGLEAGMLLTAYNNQ